MESIKVNKPTKIGFEALKKCMYEFTGQTCWLLPETYYYSGGFISAFWFLRNEIKTLVSQGETPKYSFINYETRKQIPYIYNSLIF